MKILSRNTDRRKSILVIVVISVSVLLLIGAVLFVLEKNRITNFFTDPFYTSEQEKTENATKDDPTFDNKDNLTPTEGVDGNKTTDQIPLSTDMSVALDSIQQTATTVTSKATVTNPATNGVCSFTFRKDGARPVARTVEVSNEKCEVSIPLQEFEMIGTWNLDMRYFANDTQVATTGTVDIK